MSRSFYHVICWLLLSPALHGRDLTRGELEERGKKYGSQSGNLLSGGNFDAGLSNGWMFAPTMVGDPTTAAVGGQSLKAQLKPGQTYNVTSAPMLFYPGRNYAISFWAKSSVALPQATVSVPHTKLEHRFAVTDQWQRIVLSWIAPTIVNPRVQVHFQAPTEMTFWLDGVMVEELVEPSEKFVPHTDLDLAMHLATGWKMEFSVAADDPQWITAVPGAALQLDCWDHLGIRRNVPWVTLPATSFALPEFAKREYGCFTLHGQIGDIEGRIRTDPMEVKWLHLPPEAVPVYAVLKMLPWAWNDEVRGKLAIYVSEISRGATLEAVRHPMAIGPKPVADVWGNLLPNGPVDLRHRWIYRQ